MLTPEQKSRYEQIRQTAMSELESLDREIEGELTRVKKRLLELQEDKKAVKQILDGASIRLGAPNTVPFKELNLADLSRHVDATEEQPASASRWTGGSSNFTFGSSSSAPRSPE